MNKPKSKPIPKRATKIAEEYAQKERLEPPKGTRQDKGFPLSEQKPGKDHA